jgi:hypothetical protein
VTVTLSEVEKTLHLNYSARARLSLLKNKISLDSERVSEYLAFVMSSLCHIRLSLRVWNNFF